MKKRKPRLTKRNIIEENFGGQLPEQVFQIDQMKVTEFLPSLPNAEMEVHMMIYVKGSDVPFLVRFKSPDTLGDWIEVLTEYRNRVWPDAEKERV